MISKTQSFASKRVHIIAVLFLSGGFLLPVAHATTYYVNGQSGNDDRSAGQAQNAATPWLTIQKCANIAGAGDTCSVASGSYNERVNITASGNIGQYLIVISSPARTASVYGFRIAGSYIRVEGFNVTHPANTCDNVSIACNPGISIVGPYAQVVNNYVYNWRGASGIGVDTRNEGITWDNRPSFAYIYENVIYHSQEGIRAFGDNWVIDSNEINRLYAYTFQPSWDCDYIRAWGIGVTVSNNYLHGTVLSEITNPSDGTNAHVDYLQTWSYREGRLENLVFRNNMCLAAHEMMIEGSNSGITIRNNVFANGLETASGHLGGEINIKESDGTRIVNNTFYNTGTAVYCSSATSNCVLRNCIAYVKKTDVRLYAWQLKGNANSEDHNLAYAAGVYGTDYTIIPGPPSDTTITGQDPLFVNTSSIVGPDGIPFTDDDGLRLQPTSPARQAGYGGVDLGAYGTLNPPGNLRIVEQ